MDDNRRMIQDSTRASLTLLYNISRELASITDLNTMLARVLNLSIQAMGAERGSLIVLDAAGQPVEAALVYKGQVMPDPVDQLKDTLEKGLAGWVSQQREAALVRDTSQDDRWMLRPDDAAEQSGAKSAICAPLLARDQLIGVLTIVHPVPDFFTEEHLMLMQAIGDLAGIAVRNAQLYDSLNETRRRYYDLFQDSADPIFITNPEGCVLEANHQAEQAIGYSQAELQGHSILDLHLPPRDKPAVNLHDLPVGETISYESVLLPKSGAGLPVEFHVRRIDFEARQNLQWIARDISERKKMEVLQEDLSSMIYHDLRSPLSNVSSSLEMLAALLPENSSPPVSSLVRIAMRSADRVQRLISSLLDIRRLEAGQPITNRLAVEVRTLFDEAVEYIRPLAENKQQRLDLELEPAYPLLWLDNDMARRVLVNLLENASKFTPSGGSLAAGARAQDGMVLFWVRDTGRGIPPELQEKIFDKYVSLQAEHMPRGMGLGLAFCRLAVQAHGGKIWVESRLGEGSTFYFTLPTAPEA